MDAQLINEHGLSGRCSEFSLRAMERELVSHSDSVKPGRNYSSYLHRCRTGRAASEAGARGRHCNYLGNIILKSGCCPPSEVLLHKTAVWLENVICSDDDGGGNTITLVIAWKLG